MRQFEIRCSQHGCVNLYPTGDDGKLPTHCPTCNQPLQEGAAVEFKSTEAVKTDTGPTFDGAGLGVPPPPAPPVETAPAAPAEAAPSSTEPPPAA